jgi:hypothetical protein
MKLCIAVACRTARSCLPPVTHKPLTDRVTRSVLSSTDAPECSASLSWAGDPHYYVTYIQLLGLKPLNSTMFITYELKKIKYRQDIRVKDEGEWNI